MKRSFVYYIILTGSIYCTSFVITAYGASNNLRTSQPERPLGSLWYPGPFDQSAPPPTTVRTPIVSPVMIPENKVQSVPGFTPAQPTSSLPEPKKPLGMLWYPGPYTPKAANNKLKAPEPLSGLSSTEKTPTSLMQPFARNQSETLPVLSNAKIKGTGRNANPKTNIHLNADEITFDEKTGEVIAKGNVLIISYGRRLKADSISYNRNTEIITANGNVQLFNSDGNNIFGHRMKITGDLKEAIIKGIGIILTNQSRIAASSARRFNSNVTEMNNGVYSPCKLCEPDPTMPPLWQVKAVKIIHDRNRKTIQYRDAWLEVMGYPVAYTPYLSHPDPSVKRQSGFLMPSFGGSSDLGSVGSVPYYFDLGIHRDATVTALATGEGSGGTAEYRQKFRKGFLDTKGSLLFGDNKHNIRGHINSNARFDVNETWRWGVDINRASDETYLRRYNIISKNYYGFNSSLNSQVFIEGFRERNYFKANAYAFQGIQPGDDSDSDPLVLPLIDFNHLGKPNRFGGQTVLDANFIAITREEGKNTRRVSIRPSWKIPFTDQLGGVYNFSTGINTDLYHVEDLKRENLKNYTGFSGRIVPQAKIEWRLPLVNNESSITQIIEPVAVAVLSPYGGNSNKIPNEDSKALEFDDTNLLNANRFPGIDRVEGGPRLNYGLKWSALGKKNENAEIFFGQSVRQKTDDTFSKGSGLEERFSDLVGRISISPGPYIDLLYKTRLDSDNFIPKRNEITFGAGSDALRFNTNYIFIEDQTDGLYGGREEISSSIHSKFTRFWRGSVSGIHDISDGNSRQFIATAIFENECVELTTNASRKFYKDRDLEPSDQINFKVLLKTLGSINTDIYQR